MNEEYPGAAVISDLFPLRCNLTGAENIAFVRQFHGHEKRAKSLAAAREVLEWSGHGAAVNKRDGDMSEQERLATKVARAQMLGRPVLVVDRPGAMLPNADYPPWIFSLLTQYAGRFERLDVLDYEWNRPLYREILACEPSNSR